MAGVIAPGAPGIRPTWTSSAKDTVTTALGASRVWVTLGYGILNEVYWPSTGLPQIRDLGFIVAGPSGWFEVKRVNRYSISTPGLCVPLPEIVHEGPSYRLAIDIVPDPWRDVVLISYRLTGDDVRLYVLLAPHLENGGQNNNARAGQDLTAWKGGSSLCLTSDSHFSRSSAGYVGASDGWQDFAANGQMAWTYDEAIDGNVALMGELQENDGTLALAFSSNVTGARTKARSSLSEGYHSIRHKFIDRWQKWGESLDIPDGPPEVRRQAYLSAVVLKVHEDRTFPGSVVASLSIPWGNSSDSSGGYHLVWARDCVEAGLALLAMGKIDDARAMLSYLVAIQNDDGSWSQNGYSDGRPFWHGIQLDEVGFPIVLAAKLMEKNALIDEAEGVKERDRLKDMIRRAARYLVQNGPISPQDRWENNSGISPFTLAIEIVALIAAGEFLSGEERESVLSLADYWNERIEDWTYAMGGTLASKCGVEGYYVRIGPAVVDGGLRGRGNVADAGRSMPAMEIVGMEYLHLVRLGLRRPDDHRIQNTSRVADILLKVETPLGVAYRRYNSDDYGEHEDGSPYDGTGLGRPWPLLTGERAHLELQLGHDPVPYLQMMTRMTGPGGMIPEQIWDGPPIPERGLQPGNPTGSAMPLVWAHAEFLKLLYARKEKRPIEFLKVVEKHLRDKPASGTWHWRTETPFDVLPENRDLLVEMDRAFVLHMGFDEWTASEDRPSKLAAFGRHGVRLTKAELSGRKTVDFTRYFITEGRWEGIDHHIRLAPEQQVEEQMMSAARKAHRHHRRTAKVRTDRLKVPVQ